jgi:hypothetical protein
MYQKIFSKGVNDKADTPREVKKQKQAVIHL